MVYSVLTSASKSGYIEWTRTRLPAGCALREGTHEASRTGSKGTSTASSVLMQRWYSRRLHAAASSSSTDASTAALRCVASRTGRSSRTGRALTTRMRLRGEENVHMLTRDTARRELADLGSEEGSGDWRCLDGRQRTR